MTIKAFHRNRVPFFIRPDGFIYVTHHYTGSHEQWATQLGLPEEAMNDWPRGYYWPPTNELFFYVGQYTTDYERVQLIVKKTLQMLLMKVGANDGTIIHGGMFPGEPGTPVHTFQGQEL